MLSVPLPALNDPEGERLPDGLPPVIDAHVHLFDAPLFDAIWQWFDSWGWPIRYRLYAEGVVDFLLSRGVEQLVALHYAHKPGIAASMNRWMAEIAADKPQVLGLATVHPDDEEPGRVLEEAFAAGLGGVKLHCHVQAMAPDEERMDAIYRACAAWDRPLVMHAGREPKSPGYGCDPYALCSADRIDEVLRNHPGLRLCVPHLGADEYDGYVGLLERHPNLWLDTTMMLADYFPMPGAMRVVHAAQGRVMYGTDFPNLPYAWDREIRRIGGSELSEAHLEELLGGNARRFFGLD